MSPTPTGTHHPLPFGDLSPADFERMCLSLVEREGFENVTHFGARGRDRGRDIEAWDKGQRVVFQCKRTQGFQPAQAVAEIEKLRKLSTEEQPTVVHFLLSCNPQASTIDKARKVWGDAQTCRFWGRDHLDEKVRRYPEIVERFFRWTPQGYAVKIGGDVHNSIIVTGHATIHQGQSATASEPEGYRCQAPHPGADFVHRGELDTMVERLTNSTTDETTTTTLAITTALQGAGGFGKTTLAQALCHHEKVQAAFPDGVLWVVMGERLDDAGRIRSILDSVRLWTNANPPAFESAAAAGTHLRSLVEGRRVLVVVDDVWQRSDTRPFEGLGASSALLITTRNRETLPLGTLPLDVDEMEPSEAVQLLGAGLGGKPESFEPLARQLGEWPLLLKLVNGQLRKLTARGVEEADALERVGTKLRDRGLSAFDHRDADAREDAVRLTMAAGFESRVLDEGDQERYRALAIFPEDTDIPIEVLAPYWALDLDDAEDLAERIFDLSLLQRFDIGPQTLRLHDVFREYLIEEQGSQLAKQNRRFLEAHRPESGRWSDLPPSSEYLWQHLARHLVEAGEASLLAELLVDPDYLQLKLKTTDVNSLLADFKEPAADPPRLLLADAIRKSAHCLSRDRNQLAGQLLGRVSGSDEMVLVTLAEGLRTHSGLLPRGGSLRPAGGPLQRTLEGHADWVVAVESLEGGRIVSASSDRTLRVWDVESGECLHKLEGHADKVVAVVRLDGRRIASASEDTTLRVWNVESGECLHTLEGHLMEVAAVERLESGRIVSASSDNTLRVWDIESGECLRKLEGHIGEVLAIMRWEGGRIISASSQGTLRVWDLESGECLHTLEGHNDLLVAVERLEGGRIVSVSFDETLRVWDVESGECIHVLEGHTNWVVAVERLEGGWIVSASEDTTLRIWDVESGECIHVLEGHTRGVRSVERLEVGRIVSASEDTTLRIWDVESGECLHVLEGHTRGVRSVERLEGGRIVSASYDKTLRVWNSEPGECLHTVDGHSLDVLAVEPTENGWVVSASSDKTLRVWDLESGECLHTLSGHTKGVRSVERLEGGRIVSASSDKTLRVWDLESGECLHTLEGHTNWVVAAESLGGGRIASVAFDETLRVWDVESGECLHKLRDHTDWVVAVKRLEGGRIVSASYDTTLRVWDLESGECLHTLEGHTNRILAVECFEGGRIVSASSDKTLRVWDLESGVCIHKLVGHIDKIGVIEPLEDGRIVSASSDRTLRVWDLESGECLHTLRGHTSEVVAIERLEGDRIVSASDDKTLRVWDVESGECLHTLKGHINRLRGVGRLESGHFVYVSRDGALRVWNVDTTETIAVFTGEGGISAVTVIAPRLIVAGDAAGRVHILDLVEPGRSDGP